MDLLKMIRERREILQKAINETMTELVSLPSGLVRASRRNGKYYYYLRKEQKDKNGVYLSEKQTGQIRRMLQREYDEKLVAVMKKEEKLLNKLQSFYEMESPEEVFLKLPKGKQLLVTPFQETEQQFVERWMNYQYEPLRFSDTDKSEFFSNKDERMRSKTETEIANKLIASGIYYRYEMPVYLKEFGTVYPDFTIIDGKHRRLILWEHLGKMDDSEYANRQILKLRCYQKNGYYLGENLLVTMESSNTPMSFRQLDDLIEHQLLKRIR